MRIVILLIIILNVTVGCTLIPGIKQTPVNYFEISVPDVISGVSGIEVRNIEVSGPYDKRMVFKVNSNQIKFDEYNRWSQTPESMLKRYYTILFSNTQKLPSKTFTANVLRFECDMDNEMAHCCIEVTIRDKSSGDILLKQTFFAATKLEEMRAGAFAKAISTSIKDVSSQIIILLKENL